MGATINEFKGEYRFLSNFFLCEVQYDGEIYYSTEHAYQAAKATTSADKIIIRRAPAPRDAKRLGSRLILRPDWEKVKVGIMRSLLHQKFHRHTNLRMSLLATGNVHLLEGNLWHDNFYGVCQCTRCGGIGPGSELNGKNILGKLLMEVRECLNGGK